MLEKVGICTFTWGYGTGGSKKGVGRTYTEHQCANLVRSKEPSANGATWMVMKNSMSCLQLNCHTCFAQFGSTGTDSNRLARTCLFKGKLLFFIRQCRFYLVL